MSTKICDYGCDNPGLFRKMGRTGEKWSCCENIQHCPAMKLKHSQITKNRIIKQKEIGIYNDRIEKFKKTIRKIDVNGQTIINRTTEKMLKTRKKNNSYATGSKKSAQTKKTIIDIESGYTLEKLAVIKANKTRMKIDESGTSIAQRTARKGMITRISNIDSDSGLTIYELSLIKSSRLKIYKNTKLYYASTYEYKWLEQQESIYGIDWINSNINRGPNFRYFDNATNCIRNYPSDFLVGDTIYEIKSSYIFHKTLLARQRNIIKLDTALSNGYKVKLILNFIEYDWAIDKDKILSIV